MLIEQFLREVTALPGLTGNEQEVARYIADAFAPLADEVRVDSMQSVIARIKGDGPKVMFAAHLDEIGLMVTNIEKDGAALGQWAGGPAHSAGHDGQGAGQAGPDRRHGAKAIHLLSAQERKSNYKREDPTLTWACRMSRSSPTRSRPGVLEQRLVNLKTTARHQTADDRACVPLCTAPAAAQGHAPHG